MKVRREQAAQGLKKLGAQRIPTYGLEDMRASLEDVRTHVRERLASLDFVEKQLGLEAIDVTAIVADHQVEVNAVLAVKDPGPRLITTGQTSALLHVCSLPSQWA